jgi:hypothetical protein
MRVSRLGQATLTTLLLCRRLNHERSVVQIVNSQRPEKRFQYGVIMSEMKRVTDLIDGHFRTESTQELSILGAVRQALAGLDDGEITITVRSGKVTEIERIARIRPQRLKQQEFDTHNIIHDGAIKLERPTESERGFC